jgi:hypothetical protein
VEIPVENLGGKRMEMKMEMKMEWRKTLNSVDVDVV